MKNMTSPTAHITHLARMYFAEETVVGGRTLIGKQYALIDGAVYLQHIYRLPDGKETFSSFQECHERHNWMALRAAIPSERWEALRMGGSIPSNM